MKRRILKYIVAFSCVLVSICNLSAAPVITSFSPKSGPTGDAGSTTVIITGTGFSTIAANNIVYFGGVQATVTGATTTQLTVTAPSGATFQPISVNVGGVTAYSYKVANPFIPTFVSKNSITTGSFASKVDFTTGSQPYSVAIGDLDGDGKPDLAVTNFNSAVSVFRNTSTSGSVTTGSFASKVDFATGNGSASVAIGDLDGDGKPDLAVANSTWTSNTVSVLRNTSTSGSISFASKVDFATGTNPYSVAIGDLDGDGKPDLAVANLLDNTVSVFRNTATSGSITTGSFAAKVDFATGTYSNPISVAIGDLDGDGKPDLAVANDGTSSVSVLRNTSTSGSISFASNVDFATGSQPSGVAIGDLDGDGKPDLAVANYSNSVSVLRNTATSGSITTGSFASKVDFATGNGLNGVAIGDLDGDGKPDLAVAGGNTVSVFRNTSTSGSISFASKVDFATGAYPRSVAIGDLDGDGKPDLAVANSAASSVSVLRNLSSIPVITSFSPQSGPTGAAGSTTVIITGTGFGSTAGNNIVYFGGVRATVTAATTTQLTVTAPWGATWQPISVTVEGFTAYSYRVANPFIPTFATKNSITPDDFAARVDFATGTKPQSVAIGDLDGDGKPDLAVTNWGSNTVSVFRNTSTSGSITPGPFAAKVDFATGSLPTSVAIGDLDGDGKPDLAVANYGVNTVSVLRNTATSGSITTGSFAAKVDFATGSVPAFVAIGDLDGDGKPDLVVSNYGTNTVSVLRNTSTSGSITPGSFAAKVDFATGSYSQSVAIGDLDGDGKPDLTVANIASNTVSVLLNTSTSGSITTGSFAARVDFATGVTPYSVAIGDLDGDGKPDLAVANENDNTVSVLRNTSTSGSITTGSFAARVDFVTGTTSYSVAIGDLDGDGKPDLVVANQNSNTVSVYRNTATSGSITTGSFSAKVDFATGTKPYSVAIGDLNGDGKPDLAVANNSSNTVSVLSLIPVIISFSPQSGSTGAAGSTTVIITGTGFGSTAGNNIVYFGGVQATVTAATTTQLTVTAPSGATWQPISVTVGGVTGYSYRVANPFIPTFASKNSIMPGDFAAKVDFATVSQPYSVVIADLDGDGKLDLAVANYGDNTVSIYRNTATSGSITTGSFASKVDFATGSNPIRVAIGDLDGDGKPDLAVANYGATTVSVLRNTATSGSITTGSFAAKVDFATGSYPEGVAIGDLDGDGKPDLVVTNTDFYSTNLVSVLRNTSTSGSITTGSFASKVDFATGSAPSSVAIGDLDGDGRPDLAVTNFNDNTVSVLRNTATSGSITTGSFASNVDFATGNHPQSVAIGDLDGDGKPDLAVANGNDNTASVLRNTATSGSITTGSFASRVDFAAGSVPYFVEIGDLDGDGVPDLVVANLSGSTVSVLGNFLVITSFSPQSGPTGAAGSTTVIITGTGFSTTATNNIVYFGGVRATVTAATSTQLTVTAPWGATWQPISVTVGGLTAYSYRVANPFIPTFATKGSIMPGDFASKVDFATGTQPISVEIGDLDGDGKPDLVVVNGGPNTVSVFRNTSTSGSISTGSFASKVDFATGSAPYSVAIGDLDGDGKPDLAVANANDNTVSVLRNTSASGSISFASKVDFATGDVPASVAIGDLDGDGKPDLVVANSAYYSTNLVSVLRNTSTSGSITIGSFASKVDFAPVGTGEYPYSVAIGDLDGDGKPDLAVANSKSNTISVLRNTSTSGSITFASKVDFATGSGPQSVAIGDLDGDGKSDLAVANYSSNTVSVLRNTSTSGSITTGSFASKVDFAAGSQSWSVAIGDLDGDGKPDLAVANSHDNTVSVLRNTSTSGSITTGSFAAKVDFATGAGPISVAIGDLNGDGVPDLAVGNLSGSTVSVLGNLSAIPVITSFSPQSGPTGAAGSTTVIITGTGFGSTAGNNIVYFGEVQATVTAATTTQLTVTAPWGVTWQPVSVTVRGFTGYSYRVPNPFIPTFASNNSIMPGDFASRVDFATGVRPVSVAIGDLDGDGKPDLAVANLYGNTVSVFRNTSTSGSITTGSFAAKVDFVTGGYPYSVAIGDLDGDGKPDLAVANYGDNSVSVLRNTATSGSITTGSFAWRVDFTTGSYPQSVAIGDLDGDGKPDLAVANLLGNTVSVLRNTATSGSITTGSFALNVDFVTGAYPYSVAIGDLDGDGKPDLAVANSNSNTVSVLRNTATSGSITTGSFAAKVDFATGGQPYSVAIGDLDGDGKRDLAVANLGSYTVSVLRNTATFGSITTGSFAAHVDFATGGYPISVAIGDLDGDGKPDLAVVNSSSNTVSVLRNTVTSGSITTGSFAAQVNFSTGVYPYSVAIGDLDGDGKPDLAVANIGPNTVSVLGNLLSAPVITSFSPQSGPTGDAGSTTVIITGTGFGSTAGNNIVYFGGVQATVTAATTTQLTVTAPWGATWQPISVTVGGVTAYSYRVANPFIPTFASKNSITPGDFAAHVDFATGSGPWNFAIGDLDGDGKPDLAVVNKGGGNGTVSVFRNTATSGSITTGSFASKVDFATGGDSQSVAIGDLDGDGKPDLAVVNGGANTVSVFRNTATPGSITPGSFASRVDFATGSGPIGVAIGDLDGNGKPDLAVVNFWNNTVSVLRNTSTSGSITTSSFAAHVDFATGSQPYSVAIGDLDGDGKPDLAVPNFYGNAVSVLRNTATLGSITTGSFAAKVDFAVVSGPNSVAIGDLDGDGKSDLAVANYGASSVSVLRNTSTSGSITTGSFAAHVDFATGSQSESVAIGDLDGDGKPDLAVANIVTNTVSVLRNTSTSGSITTGSFATKVDFTTGSYGSQPVSVAIGDLDGDGKPDLAVGNIISNTVSVLRNLLLLPVITSFSPQSGPTGAAGSTTVIITGTDLGSTAGDNIVYFGGVQATVTAATTTQLTVTAPWGATWQPISVTVGGLTAYSYRVANPFIPTFATKNSIMPDDFAAKVDFATGGQPYSVAIGDLDGDGKPDLAVVNQNSNNVSVFRNTSTSGSITTGSFASKVDFATGSSPYGVAIGDLDGDGKPDLAVVNQNSNTVSVFRNTSTSGSITTGSFASNVDFATGFAPVNVAIGDLDGDGKPDLAVTNFNDNTISVLRNTATSGSITTGSFASKVDFATGSNPEGVAIGDLDGDGKPDLAVTNINDNTVSVLRNASTSGSITTGSFASNVDFATGYGPYSVAIGDLDGDGKPDLAVTNINDNTVSVLRNTATSGSITTGSFAANVDFVTGRNPYSVAIGDLDGDGKPDLAVACQGSSTVSVLRNTSTSGSITTGSFAAKVDFATGSTPKSVAIGDLDGDGKPDLAVANYGSNTVSVLRNLLSIPVIISFSPQSGPTGAAGSTTVIITGTGFGSTAGNNIVYFGGVQATVTAATTTQLTVTAPWGATWQPISVTVGGFTAYSYRVANPFIPTFKTKKSIMSGDFASKVDFATGIHPLSVAIGDLDGDGKPDLAVANGSDNTVSVFHNTSTSGFITTGSFVSKVDFATGSIPYSVTIGDLDGDGKPDLAVANSNSSSVSVLRNTSTSGSISFAANVDFATGGGPYSVAIGDLDGDGKPDMAVVNLYDNTISVLRNTATSGSIISGSFAAKVDFAAVSGPYSVAIGDLDGDGKPDLAVANLYGNSVSVFRNTSTFGSITTGSFAAHVDFAAGSSPYSVAIGDLDGDGKSDLVVANRSSNSVSVLRNTATSGSITTGSFAAHVDFLTGDTPGSVAIGDLDGDGKPDLAVANYYASTVSVFRNTATSGSITTGSFAAKVDFATGANPGSVAIGDLDGNGKPDMVVINGSDNTVSVLSYKPSSILFFQIP